MEAWQQRALPANFDKALSLYKAWLLAKAKDSGLVVSDITLLPTTNNNAAYKAIGYQNGRERFVLVGRVDAL